MDGTGFDARQPTNLLVLVLTPLAGHRVLDGATGTFPYGTMAGGGEPHAVDGGFKPGRLRDGRR